MPRSSPLVAEITSPEVRGLRNPQDLRVTSLGEYQKFAEDSEAT